MVKQETRALAHYATAGRDLGLVPHPLVNCLLIYRIKYFPNVLP